MHREEAEIIGLRALAFLAADDRRIDGFLRMTGTEPQHLRESAADPAFLGAVLDYILGIEALLLEFTASEECDDTLPARARRALPGGTARDEAWTR